MDIKTRYEAAMVLSGVGDALGYKNGEWEFCLSGELIHKEAEKLGGVEKIKVKLPNWMVSDDTVMHLALAEALTTNLPGEDKDSLYSRIAAMFQLSMRDMDGRAPGPTTMGSCMRLRPDVEKGYRIPFDPRGGGCGAAMRAMCIGLRYPRPEEIDELVAISIESGRMTHHHPTGYLGSLAAALFTSYAVQEKDVKEWGWSLLNEVLPVALEYIHSSGCYVEENVAKWDYFHNKWADYLVQRGMSDGKSKPIFPEKYGIKERDVFYKSLSFDGWGGANGHDAPMIAYDALLSSKGDWKELCSRAMFHSGDSDSTGVMAACWYGAMYGFNGVPECNHQELEYRDSLVDAGEMLFGLSHPQDYKKDILQKVKENTDKMVEKLPAVPSNDDITEPEGGAGTSMPSQNLDDKAMLQRAKSLADEWSERSEIKCERINKKLVSKLPVVLTKEDLKKSEKDSGTSMSAQKLYDNAIMQKMKLLDDFN